MNTNNTMPRNKLLDPEWIIAVQEAIDAQPENMSDVVEPELMGRFDCEMGLPCEPLQYYARLGDVEAYIIGYKEATAIWAEMVQEVNNSLHAPVDYEAELQELLDGIDEENWIRWGC